MSSDTVDMPSLEVVGEEQQVVIQQEQQEEQQEESIAFPIFVKTPTEIGTIQVQVTPNDTILDIQSFLYETAETCLYTSYGFFFNGVRLNEYSELESIEGFGPNSTLDMNPVDYNERSAKLHVERLKEVMAHGVGDFPNEKSPTMFSYFSYPEKSVIPTEDEDNTTNNTESTDSAQNEGTTATTEAKAEENKEQKETTTTTQSGENKEEADKKKSNKQQKKPNNNTKQNKGNNKKEKEEDKEKLTPAQKARKEEITEIKAFEKPLLSNYFPSNPSPQVQCVRQMIYSGWSPVPASRQLHGDLFYLDITLLEGSHICVTASVNGFFINQSTQANFNPAASNKATTAFTLHELLTQVSRQFRRGLGQILTNVSQRHAFEMQPSVIPVNSWVSRPKNNRFDLHKATQSVLSILDPDIRCQPRDWNEELQTLRELPKSTVQERIIRDRAFAKVNSDFVEAAIRGAKAVVGKSMQPINPMEPERSHMFLYNNIFFSFPLDTRDLYTECGGDAAARASANNDLRGIHLFNLADVEGLHTLATAIIDYKGQRVIAQSLVPGILSNEKTSNIYYGSMDNGKTIKADPEFHERLLKASTLLHLSEQTVVPEEGEAVKLCTSFETKGIIGTDGRRYVLDLVRATPRDPNYAELKDQMCVLRPELIATYAEYNRISWIAKRQAEKKEKGEAATEESQEKPPALALNPNLYSTVKLGDGAEQQEKDIQALTAVGTFLKGIIIPKLIEDLILFNITPVDGQTLTATMHTRGINMRYLGSIAKSEAATKFPFIHDLFFNEMITRAAKHIFNATVRDSQPSELAFTIAHFMNCFLGTETGSINKEEKSKRFKHIKSKAVHELTQQGLWEQIAQSVKAKFDYDIITHSVPMESRLIVLRSLCLKVGIQVLAKDYDFTTDLPFTQDEIVDLQPVVKHLNPRSGDGLDLLEAGKSLFNQKKYDVATEFLNESLAIYHQVHGPIHSDTANVYSNLAMLAFYNEDYDLAIDHEKNALVITEKTLGIDHHDTVHAYANLAIFCRSAGRFTEALGYLKHALYLTDLLGGEYNPERSSTYTAVSALLEDSNKLALSLEFLNQALKHQEFLFGPSHLSSANTYHLMSYTYAKMNDFKESIEQEKKAYHIFEKELGPEHQRTQDSGAFLSSLTQTAVQIVKFKQARLQQMQFEQFQKEQQQAKRAAAAAAKLEKKAPSGDGSVNEILSYINGPKLSGSRPAVKVISKNNVKPTTTTTTTTTATKSSTKSSTTQKPTTTTTAPKSTSTKQSQTTSSPSSTKPNKKSK
ncbi:hypothetical protein CYY_008982 [Polysphondylium violaceum]|uniref:Clustered mitochondria protein homolog n=1 Tax=Polysphondylium violaceum TaxID=133409 RepID=A0A8J4PNJ1_9MYCE|nr:hypothetical protein CYY_008982 [Polysphondylium violaceum]